jgi:4-hydroxybenzoate polyprenyltransferase
MIDSVVAARLASRRRLTALTAIPSALRVRQWTKNLLLFAGLVFAAKLGDAARWGEAWLAFVAYCAASSAAYLVNDVRDAESDRQHPLKRRRPVASGRLRATPALLLSAALAAAGLACALVLGSASLALLAGFLALQLAYSFGLKQIVVLDVVTIAALFTIRAAAGAEAVNVQVSPWLLVCAALLALFLALAKRRAELCAGRDNGHRGRRVLAHYSLAAVDRALVAVALATLGAYCLYALGARHSPEVGVTIPFVVFGVGRYLLLVRQNGIGETPEEILLTDLPIQLAIGAWAVTAAVVLMTT